LKKEKPTRQAVHEEPLAWIRQHVHEEYGIYFPESKIYSLKSKLQRRVRNLELEDVAEYARHLRDNPDEVPYFLDAITTNKTKFFREPKHWHFMEEELIPAWRGKNEIRIWSGACSSGEEPYTMAILLEEAHRNHSTYPRYRVLASDISEEVLRRGSRGIYHNRDLQPVKKYNSQFVSRYFDRDPQGNFQVNRDIRRKVYFRQFNLTFKSNPFSRKFDLIVLKNVLIYFDNEMIQNVIDNSTELLADNGHLIISHTESLHEIEHSLGKISPSIFQKR